MAARSHHFVIMTALAAVAMICMTSTSEGGQFSPVVEASLSESNTSDMVVPSGLGEAEDGLSGEGLFCAEEYEDEARISGVEPLSKQSCTDACKAGAVAIEAFCRTIPDAHIKFACLAARLSMPLCFAFCAKYY